MWSSKMRFKYGDLVKIETSFFEGRGEFKVIDYALTETPNEAKDSVLIRYKVVSVNLFGERTFTENIFWILETELSSR